MHTCRFKVHSNTSVDSNEMENPIEGMSVQDDQNDNQSSSIKQSLAAESKVLDDNLIKKTKSFYNKDDGEDQDDESSESSSIKRSLAAESKSFYNKDDGEDQGDESIQSSSIKQSLAATVDEGADKTCKDNIASGKTSKRSYHDGKSKSEMDKSSEDYNKKYYQEYITLALWCIKKRPGEGLEDFKERVKNSKEPLKSPPTNMSIDENFDEFINGFIRLHPIHICTELMDK
ncbi:Hypothetical protein CINCED_3A007784 [Cinara cedri]|uniref:Uncharacterized protein n=1 Tax=Cinara cedri TaxID=506608 RepID=A0A5E4NL65_9HEMI|nr:Hypothetical protein CINCED_3A007784 [Cinara cedri]